MNNKYDISEEEELAVWLRFKKIGKQEDRHFLIEKYTPLVKYVAGRIVPNVPSNVDFDDLIGFGTFGLLDAVEKFDPEKGIKFKTYGITRIRGQIYDELRSLDWVPRSIRQKYKMLEEVRMRYQEEMNCPISDEELAAQVGISVSEVNRISNMSNDSNVGSLDDVWSSKKDEDEITVIDTLRSSENNSPDAMIEREEVKKVIVEEIKKLPEKEKKVLILYYYENLTLKEIGEVMGVTESRVSQLHGKAIRYIRASLDNIKKAIL